MTPFHLVFSAVLVVTLVSGAAATALALTRNGRSATQRRVIERLSHIAFLGASAIIALLSKFGES